MGNGITSNVQTVGHFTPDTIDSSFAPWLMAGSKWGSVTMGTGVNVTFSFFGSGSTYKAGYGHGQADNAFGLTAAQEWAAYSALANFAAVSNLSFTQVTDSASLAGDIRFANTSEDTVATAGAYYPHQNFSEGGDIWFGTH